MQITRLSGAAALGTARAALLGTAALADSIYVSPPAVIDQQIVDPSTTVIKERSVSVPLPSSTVIEERSVTTPQSPVVIQSSPAVVGEPVVVQSEPDMIMKRTLTVGTRKPANCATSTDISLQTGPEPVFSKRIERMKQQVDLGLSKGMMTASAANCFKTRLNSLSLEAGSVTAAGTPKTLSDSLEQKLTGINIEIADAMNAEKKIGSQGQIQ